MGCYDTIIANCPTCGDESEFQSKSGECLFSNYSLDEAPFDVLYDANRHAPNVCPNCNTVFEIDRENRKVVILN